MAEVKKVTEDVSKRGEYLKILNKKKDTVLVFHPGLGKKELKWNGFNDFWEIDKDDPHKAYLKPEGIRKTVI